MHPSEWADLPPAQRTLYSYRGAVGRLACATHRAKVGGHTREDITAAIRGTNHSPIELAHLCPLRARAEGLRTTAIGVCTEEEVALAQQEAIATQREEWTCVPPSDKTISDLRTQLAAIK